ncbi:hypothetical protein SAMN05216339_1222 [Nitrosomonas eutropha]|uniref:Uncharacterized protein n=1 Tax=Nitrosomonas eutropha TaxID=916 RepID=A0A1I7JDJ7_9PROT|nr:hypothetical protein [Nitrosomonas eutropha]SFU83218.1 hypothetical protein SAMN05216339_1222 [Nitrosomonas eutropha]
MFDAQIFKTDKFISRRDQVTWYTCEVLIPSLFVQLPLMSDKPFQLGAKGKAVLGYTADRKALRVTDFQVGS